MTGRGRPEAPTSDALSWEIYQLHDALLRIGDFANQSLRVLRGAERRQLRNQFPIPSVRFAVVRRAVEEISTLSVLAAAHMDDCPNDDFLVTFEGARTEALRELSLGAIHDPNRVLLVAKIAPPRDGLVALAHALRASDAYLSWQGLTLGRLLAAFRRITAQTAQRLVVEVGLAPGDDIASCERASITRLAARLEERAAMSR